VARKPNPSQTKKVHPTIAVANYERLEWLAETGLYGATASEVAKHFITNGLAELTGQGVLPIKLPDNWRKK
jgi:hypothetical protein